MWSLRWLTVTLGSPSLPRLGSWAWASMCLAMRFGLRPTTARSLSRTLALDQAGVAVKELSLRTPTLDDVFLGTGTHLEGSA